MFGIFTAAAKLVSAGLVIVGGQQAVADMKPATVTSEYQDAYVMSSTPSNPAAAAFTFGNHSSVKAPAPAAVPEEAM